MKPRFWLVATLAVGSMFSCAYVFDRLDLDGLKAQQEYDLAARESDEREAMDPEAFKKAEPQKAEVVPCGPLRADQQAR